MSLTLHASAHSPAAASTACGSAKRQVWEPHWSQSLLLLDASRRRAGQGGTAFDLFSQLLFLLLAKNKSGSEEGKKRCLPSNREVTEPLLCAHNCAKGTDTRKGSTVAHF
jgi:hypothetical protein